MKTIYSKVLMIAGVALLGTINPAFASEPVSATDSSARRTYEQAKRFEVGPFIGYHTFENKQNLDDSLTYGARLGYNFTSHFGVEGAVGVVNTNVKDKAKVGAQKGQYRSPTDDVDLTTYQLDAIYQFNPEKRFTPFVTAGFGSYHYSPEVLSNDMSTFDYGIGAKYWMKKDMALRVDLKDQVGDSFHNYSATVEVVFAFGGRSHKPAPVVTPEPQPEPIEVAVVPEEVAPVVEEQPVEQVIDLVFEDVYFNFDKSTLTEAAKVILDRNVQILNDNPNASIRIIGHTSASGSDAYNQRLSERRAKAVENYLVTEGKISLDRLSTLGYGETIPAKVEVNPKKKHSEAAKANMRVIFENIVK